MSVFNLAISCLPMSGLPWFMDLTFQVHMRYCSSQHWILLSPPDTSTTEHHFRFGPAASFFLELLVIALHFSPGAYWTSSDCRLIFQFHISLPFHTVYGVLVMRILEWFAIPSSSGPHFVRPIHCDLSVLGDSARHGSQLHWVMQAPSPQQDCDPCRGPLPFTHLQIPHRAVCLMEVGLMQTVSCMRD